jgi:sterol 3beta-glucosyltransferase
MKVAILTLGSRGDVQPYVALGAGLEAAGHEVILATGKGFAGFVAGHELRHAALDVDLFERMQTPEGKAALAGKNLPGTIRKVMATYRRLLDDEWAAARGADAVVYHPKALGGYHVAEALGVPGFLAHPVPMFSPTRAFPNPVLPFADLGGYLNEASYGAFLRLLTAPFHRTINRWRKASLGLPPRRFMASELGLEGEPVRSLVCCSPRVVPPPADWRGSATVTGYWFLERRDDWRPPSSLSSFLASGPPPVYVGFGSLAGWTPEGVVAAAIAALRKTGQRGVLVTGGGRVPPGLPADVYAIESAPHDWLFPRMAAVVHHGGAGTTAEGLRAGKPAVICPTTLNDQAFWGRRVAALGAGPEPVPQRKLTVERLAGAIRAAAGNTEMRERAAELGREIRAERGVARAVETIEGGELQGIRGRAGGGR